MLRISFLDFYHKKNVLSVVQFLQRTVCITVVDFIRLVGIISSSSASFRVGFHFSIIPQKVIFRPNIYEGWWDKKVLLYSLQ